MTIASPTKNNSNRMQTGHSTRLLLAVASLERITLFRAREERVSTYETSLPRGRIRHGFSYFALVFVFLAGCQSVLNVANLKQPANVAETDEAIEDEEAQGLPGPIEKLVQMAQNLHSDEAPAALTSEGRDEYEKAVQLYEAKEYKAAEKEFKRIAKEYENSTVREDALFMTGESQFQQEKYSWAQDSYDELFRDFPSTRHVDVATRRLFKIAKTWLGQPEFATTGNIQQVNLEDPSGSSTPTKEKFPHSSPLKPNLFDRSRPVFDTNGRALQALKSIWLNDPTGPLADDALMLEATYYLRIGKYMDADRVFGILREEYPKSDHLQAAFVLGSHVKLMSYQGAAYDGKTLEEARQLKESTLRLFPNAPEAKRIREEMNNLTEAKAQRDWQVVNFYRKKNKPKAMAIYCYEILKKYPETRYAKLAQETLIELGLERSELAGRDPESEVFLPTPLKRPIESRQSESKTDRPTPDADTKETEDRPSTKATESPVKPNRKFSPGRKVRPSPLPGNLKPKNAKPKRLRFPKIKPPRLFPFRRGGDESPPRPVPRDVDVDAEDSGRVKL